MTDQKNLLVAIVLSVAIIVLWQVLFPGSLTGGGDTQQSSDPVATAGGTAPLDPGGVIPGLAGPSVADVADRASVLAADPRIAIATPALSGTLRLTGARIDDLTLLRYGQTTEPDSDRIVLLSPEGTAAPYFAQTGFLAAEANVALPDATSLWQADADVLTQDRPITLTWDNGQGLRFERVIAVDSNYMFTVSDRVTNQSGDAVTLFPFSLVRRIGTPDTLGFFILHEGPIGVLNENLEQLDYDDLRDDRTIAERTTGGWIGITDQYWMAALVPDQNAPVEARFAYEDQTGRDVYQTDVRGEAMALAPGDSATTTSRIFAGAKVLRLLDAYQADLGIDRFELAVDFGLFFFLTKPIFLALRWISEHLGNFGFAILVLTVGIKLAFFPLASRSYRSMAKMKELAPELKVLRDQYKDDRARQQQEMMALYKKHGANPVSGCLPILLQIPVFFALYKVLFVTIEMRHEPFIGWINDLSVADPTNIFTLFGLLPDWVPFDFMHLGLWPLIMGVSMYLQQKLNPQPPDPMQARIMMMLPIVFTFVLARFPAGLVIYWAWNNILSIAQQWAINRRVAREGSKT
ncbi:MAG: membrane protein insertase YidC [Alphaproteobacteria bacterium]